MADEHVRASELIGSSVETSGGSRLGRVVDLVFAPLDASRVTHLLIGPSTFLGRFSVLRHAARPLAGLGASDLVPWDEVERIDRRRIVVRRATALEPGSSPPEEASGGSA